ncbi:hypothetical protein ACFQ1S_22010, partial [Kibdelosporangium lantanae]
MRVDTLTLVREARADDRAVIAEVHTEAWRVAYRDLFESSFLAKQLSKDMPKTTFADVAGADEAVEELY